jgi:stage II sporulation protein R
MKKMYLILFIISLIVLGGCTYIDSQEERIRIIANSNTSIDQEEKEKLRDALLEIFYYENTIDIKNNIYEINKLLKEKVKLSHDFNIEYKKVSFPAKVLNNRFIPSGTYKTLLITIGEGKGDNWWSVLYPEFFGINYDDSDEIKYKSFIYELLNSN